MSIFIYLIFKKYIYLSFSLKGMSYLFLQGNFFKAFLKSFTANMILMVVYDFYLLFSLLLFLKIFDTKPKKILHHTRKARMARLVFFFFLWVVFFWGVSVLVKQTFSTI